MSRRMQRYFIFVQTNVKRTLLSLRENQELKSGLSIMSKGRINFLYYIIVGDIHVGKKLSINKT